MKQVYSNSGELCTPLKERRGCKIREKKNKDWPWPFKV